MGKQTGVIYLLLKVGQLQNSIKKPLSLKPCVCWCYDCKPLKSKQQKIEGYMLYISPELDRLPTTHHIIESATLFHSQVDGHTFVFENVGADGEKLDGSSGNLLNPGKYYNPC